MKSHENPRDKLPPEQEIKLRRTISIHPGCFPDVKDLRLNTKNELVNTQGLDLKHQSNADFKEVPQECARAFQIFKQNRTDLAPQTVLDTFIKNQPR